MQKSEEKDNSRESVFAIAGSIRGIKVTLLGPRDEIIGILRLAMKSSSVVREIIWTLTKAGKNSEKSVVEEQKLI